MKLKGHLCIYKNAEQGVKEYKTLSIDTVKNKHYAPAIKEWNNSVYNYNNKGMIDIPVKDAAAKSFIKSYFNLVMTPKLITKSHRMRTLIRRSSSKNVLISNPEIKQNNNKAVITVYLFNRENQLYKKKLLFIKKWLKKNNDNNLNSLLYMSNSIYNHAKYIGKTKLIYNHLVNRKFLHKLMTQINLTKIKSKRKNFRKVRRVLRKEISSFNPKKNYYSNYLSASLLKKKFLLKNIFFFTFIKWALSIFKIKTVFYIPRDKRGRRLKNERLKLFVIKGIKHRLLLDKHYIKLNDLNGVNVILLRCLIFNLKKILSNSFEQRKNINLLFIRFKNKYHRKYVKRFLKKQILGLSYLNRSYLNMFKFEKYLPFLKTFVKNFYNKKLEFNFVEQKYLHMNSDILSEAISVKLRKKRGNVLRVLRKSMKLIKLPKIIIKDQSQYRQNNIKEWHGNFKNKDFLYGLFEKMFQYKLFSFKKKKSRFFWRMNIRHILSLVKYKWTTGVRVEARGRLTRRFTASRALYKFKYKGNLKNLDNLLDSGYLHRKSVEVNKSPKLHMLRAEFKPNLQHTFAYSNKRIGSFGIKAWISGN